MSLEAYPYIFGNNATNFTYGPSSFTANNKCVGKYTLASADDIYNIIISGNTQQSTTGKIKGVIYSDNSNAPDALLGVTDEVVGWEADGLIVLPFATPLSLSAGDYWIGFINDTTIYLWSSNYVLNSNLYNADTYADGPSDPFGSTSGSYYKRIVYASDAGIPVMGISYASGYSILKSAGGLSQAVGYAVLSTEVTVGVSQAVGYAVLEEQSYGNNNFARNPNCVALYRFEADEIEKDSKGSNDLTASVSSPTTTLDHREGNYAADFDDVNSQYFYIDDSNLSSNFPYKGGASNFDFTICVWARFNTVVAWDKDHFIVSKGRTAFSLGILRSISPQLTMYLDNDAYVVSTPLEQDKWYHISVAYNVTSNYLQIRVWDYISDSLHSNAIPSVNIDLVANTNQFRIGSAVGDTDYADISLDELVIFNKALSTEDMDLIRQGNYTFANIKPLLTIIA